MKNLSREFLEKITISVDKFDNEDEILNSYYEKGFSVETRQYVSSSFDGKDVVSQITLERHLTLSGFMCPDCGYKVQVEEFFEVE
jgi:hypothetical protein